MKIGIANDHQGVLMKQEIVQYLEEKGYEIVNYGTDNVERVDYPDYAHRLCEAVLAKEVDYGIAICYTGIGMSIACNKVNGIRAAKVCNQTEATLTRQHNDANILVLSAVMDMETVKEIITIFITTEFSNEERHVRRIGKLESSCI